MQKENLNISRIEENTRQEPELDILNNFCMKSLGARRLVD